MSSCSVTCPVKSLLEKVQEGNVLSTFLTKVGVKVVKEEVIHTNLMRK
jgi:hypothetical protein